jgi:glutathione S-transferase
VPARRAAGSSLSTGERLGADVRNETQEAYVRKELDGLLDLLDAQFEASPYLLGDSFSLADLMVASTIGFAASTGVSLAGHARLRGWLERCQARPSMAAVMGK